jgi:hypothetical protein
MNSVDGILIRVTRFFYLFGSSVDQLLSLVACDDPWADLDIFTILTF